MNITAYPLQWPTGQARSLSVRISPFDKKTFDVARKNLSAELKRLGARDIVLSTNVVLRQDGYPSASASRPKDHGVAVYFKYKNRTMVFACDKWSQIECNMKSIEKTIEAIRGIERWGSSDMMERAFTGITAIAPPPSEDNWWEVLYVGQNYPIEQIKEAYRREAMKAHPDNGGSHEQMLKVNRAWEQAQKARS